MCGVLLAAFLFVGPSAGPGLGDKARIIFFHVPCAMVSVVAFCVSMVQAVRYLLSRNLLADARSAVSAELGLLFCVLATITGAIYARVTWGAYWSWDPRQTTVFFLLLIYGAYFVFRSAIEDSETRARLSAIYAIIAFAATPFLVFVLPYVTFTLHPGGTLVHPSQMDAAYRVVLMCSMAGTVGLYAWLFSIGTRVEVLELKERGLLS